MYIARQPIFDDQREIYGYELLFRSSEESNSFRRDVSSTAATATVLGGLFEEGMDTVVDGKKAFVNFDYDFLMSDTVELIDPSVLVVEVLEDVAVDYFLVKRLEDLKSKGYTIVLDDFLNEYDSYPLVTVADIIKYDIRQSSFEDIESDVKLAISQNKILLAEKIETKEEFLSAKNMGFKLFQGYFFLKPSIITKSNDKAVIKEQYTRVLKELKKEEPSYQKLAEIIETDINLAYRFVKALSNKNSGESIYSIKTALIYMGFKDIERWINILMLKDIGTDKPTALINTSLVRFKFSEFIAKNSNYRKRKLEVSMMCLLSTLDSILDMPIDKALEGIALSEDIKEALINQNGPLFPVLSIVIAYEKADWNKVNNLSETLKMDHNVIYRGYLDALKWAKEMMDIL